MFFFHGTETKIKVLQLTFNALMAEKWAGKKKKEEKIHFKGNFRVLFVFQLPKKRQLDS